MRPKEIIDSLECLIAAAQPAFIWGPPGVDKSQTVAAVTTKLGRELRDVRAVQFDPVDLRGLPLLNGDGRTHWSVPDFLPHDGTGVLFLDELNAADRSVRAAMRRFNVDGAVSIEWAATCSKMRAGEFGGGAAVITKDDVRWLSTNAWVRDQLRNISADTLVSA